MTITLKADDGEHQATIMHIVLDAQQVLEVSDTGITIFDQTTIKLLITYNILIKQYYPHKKYVRQFNELKRFDSTIYISY